MSQIKVGNIIFDDWIPCGQNGYKHNFYRMSNLDFGEYKFSFGLVVCPNLDTFISDPNKCHWKVVSSGNELSPLFFLQEIFEQIYGCKTYSYDELEIAKDDVDDFLIKMNKLTVFI